MIDEIDYFPKRDKFKKKKPDDGGWGELKKLRNAPEGDKSDQDKKKKGKRNPATRRGGNRSGP